MRESESRLAMAIECAGLGLWDQDFRTGSVTRGDNWMRMLGYEPGEIEWDVSAWKQLIHPDDKPHVERCVRDHEAGLTQTFSVEHRMRAKSGQWKWIRNWGRIIQRDENGKPIRAIGMHLDINERKRAEDELAEAKRAAEAANQAKSDFLANMSHEIRTPLTAMLGYADLLMAPNLSQQEQREFVRTIHRNGEILLALINYILDLSKIEAGGMTVEQTDCSVRQIVEDVVTLMRVRAMEKGLNLQIDYLFPLPRRIRTDPVRLRQILTNLVDNAIKFTEQGSVRIAVRCTPPQDVGRRVEFAVTDTGIGMRSDQLGRLFEPFTQADTSATRRFAGTGLGLAISRRLAEILGGDLCVATEPGRGSTFTLTIDPGPLQSVPMVASFADEEVEPAKTGAAHTLHGRVLLAEDGREIRRLVREVLSEAGLVVDVAENGGTAREKAAASAADGRPYDLILMDIQMPEMDGYEATRLLRADGWSGPIVALTARAMSDDREKCLQAGCDDYLTKPLNREEMLATIARHLKQEDAFADSSSISVSHRAGSEGPLISSLVDHPVMAGLLGEFVEELPGRAKKIEDALRKHDLQSLAELAHQLKGAAGIYGFSPIAETAKVLNRQSTNGDDFQQLQATVSELVDLCARAAH